jgi:hypothetical protein
VYHISIAWAGMSCEMDDFLFTALQREFGQDILALKFKVSDVKLKIGNEVSMVSLALESAPMD